MIYSKYNHSLKLQSRRRFIKDSLAFIAFVLLGQMLETQYFIRGLRNFLAGGAVEIGSALLDFLTEKVTNLSENISTIRLFCDGCPGQNKNNPLIHTLMYFLGTGSHNIKEIVVTFPVRGHSFMPADRVFGRVEKLLRKQPTMTTREEYYSVYQSVGEVKKLGEDWSLFNSKCLSKRFRNINLISEKKIIFLKKTETVVGSPSTSDRSSNVHTVTVKSTNHFRFQSDSEQYISLQKRGWSSAKCFSTPLEPVLLGHAIKAAKKKDVASLLELMYGDNWKSNDKLSWYKKVLDEAPECHLTEENDDEENDECDCLEIDIGLHI